MLLADQLAFLFPAIGLLTNIDRVIEVAEGAALVATAVGLTRPSVARKVAKVDDEIDRILETPEVVTGLEVVKALEDGQLAAEEVGNLAARTLSRQMGAKKESLRNLRKARLDR